MAHEELAQALRVLRGHRRPQRSWDLVPGCAFGALVRERLEDLERHLEEVKARLNGLLFLVAGAVVVEIVLRLVR